MSFVVYANVYASNGVVIVMISRIMIVMPVYAPGQRAE
jgi:hypothetical protein